MYGLYRGTITLLAAGAAGLGVWGATRFDEGTNRGYWISYGILAGAGLLMALSQLIGGWTKWGWPRMSRNVFLWAFLPTAVAVTWIAVAMQPAGNALRANVVDWSGDIGLLGLVRDLGTYLGVLAFGLGLVFGLTFDTSGRAVPAAPPVAEPEPVELEPVRGETRTDDVVEPTHRTPAGRA